MRDTQSHPPHRASRAFAVAPPFVPKGEASFAPVGTQGDAGLASATTKKEPGFTSFHTKEAVIPPFGTQDVAITPVGTQGVAAQQQGDATTTAVLLLADIGFAAPTALLARHGLELVQVAGGAPIPGSYWGEPEAGVIASRVYARADTPAHSLLHEACHLLVADPARRAAIHTDASDSLEEEDATCYLQIVLADDLPGFGRARALADMDAWGYSFRLGSARAWFERDAEDARAFLQARGLLPPAP